MKTYAKHTRELKKAYNYLKQKKGKQIFEQIAFKSIEAFYEEACRANEQLMSEAFDERLMMAAQNMVRIRILLILTDTKMNVRLMICTSL